MRRTPVLLSFALCVGVVDTQARPDLRAAAEAGRAALVTAEERWHATMTESSDAPGSSDSWRELFGYAPPGQALQIAIVHAFLFERDGQSEDAVAAAAMLRRMSDYRAEVPSELTRARVEYEDGLPAVPNFFQLGDYAESWRRISTCDAVDATSRRVIEAALAGSADFVFRFPEWGPHNRAMLRAHGLLEAALALPDHPRAATWRRMADVLAHDSLEEWEVEDASLYHPIWLQALFEYAEAAGREDVFTSVKSRWYLRYFLDLLGPDGTIPEFGDAWTRSSLGRYELLFEWGAAKLDDPELKWAAARVREARGATAPMSVGEAVHLTRLADRAAPRLAPRKPASRSACLDELLAKKVVIRSGRGPRDFYMLLNFRDEGDGGLLFRDYLRHTLAVEHEKMHHGHADENAISLLMDGGSVLLHDAGYRDVAPSGPHGAWRADVFHDRLVMRAGRPTPGQSTLDFLLDDGHYRPVRTQKIDFVEFDDVVYSRTRVIDDALGMTWDRIVLVAWAARAAIVIDTAVADRAGERTVASLYAFQEYVSGGARSVLGRTRTLGGRTLPDARSLLIVMPTTCEVLKLNRHRQEERVVCRMRQRSMAVGERLTLTSALVSVPGDADAPPAEPFIRVTDDGFVSVRMGSEQIDMLVKLDLDAGLREENVRPRWDASDASHSKFGVTTDADFAFVVRGGARPRWGAVNMTRVEVDRRLVFESRPFQVFQPTGRSDRVGRSRWRRWEGDLAD